MWPTTDGLRILRGAEADLVRRAVTEMVTLLQDEFQSQQHSRAYGITWFDQWDVEQRVWLLDMVTCALLLPDRDPPPPAAMFEATVDAIFLHVIDEVEFEIESTDQLEWRQALVGAFTEQNGRQPAVSVDEVEMRPWRRLVGQISDAILGNPSYQQAENFRDGEPRNAERFLLQRGLPLDYLQRIPPLPKNESTRRSIESIRLVIDQ